MLTLADFFDVVRSFVPRLQSQCLDREQERVLSAPPETVAFVLTGPRARKTTVPAFCVLKHVCVAGMKPGAVIAKEFRACLLSWGIAVDNEARRRATKTERAALDAIDLNQFRVGTIDLLKSLCSQLKDSIP